MKKLFFTMAVILLIPVFSSTVFAIEMDPRKWFDKDPKGKTEEKKPEQKDIKEPQKAEPAKAPQEVQKKDVQPDVKASDKPVQPQAKPEQVQQSVQPQTQTPVTQPQQPVQKADTVPAVVPAQTAEPDTSRKFISSLDASSPQAAAVLKDVVDVMYCGKPVEEIALDELKKSVVEGPFYGYLMARSIGDKAVYKDIVGIFRKLNCESTYRNSLEMYLMNQKTGRSK